MAQPTFFKQPPPLTLADLAALTGAELVDPSCAGRTIAGTAALDRAGPMHLTFCENRKYAAQLAQTHAGACFVADRLVPDVPSHVAALRVAEPYRAFVTAMRKLYPDTLRPLSWCGHDGVAEGAVVHPSARLEDGVVVEPLAVIGADVEIGSGTVIGSGAVIGANVRIGRDCGIGAGASVLCALIGNGVVIHPGCRIGQDGFGYVMGARGHLKVPQAGRVIIQNGVEIGAGCTIDRGALADTVIGEGTKIDNLVQIGHNVTVGENCLLISQVGIAGSTKVGNRVTLAGQVGVAGHLDIGDDVVIGPQAGVPKDIPAGTTGSGSPFMEGRTFMRNAVLQPKLPELFRRVQELEKELARLKKLLPEE